MTNVTIHSFGFPLNVTLEEDIEKLESLKKMNLENKNVHFKLKMDKLIGKNFNQQDLVSELKESTHAKDVKVTFVYNTETSIRSAEVTEQNDVVEKFKAYAELNEIKYSDSTLDKIANIRDNMSLESFTPHDTFTLVSASIRGAIGLMDQGHREQVDINFEDEFNDGIIAITGKIGSGKSTLLENLSPYPCMLTRSGSLKDHFCLKDSHRILVYRTSSGSLLRLSMFIDGKAKNVMNRYFVETKEPNGHWESVKSIDGSTDSYTAFVESTFGPKTLFLRTSFYTNSIIKGIPDLSQATKSEKMELFSILAGTDYLSVFVEQSKLKIKEEEKSIENIKGQLKDFDNIEQKIEDNNIIIEENNKKIEEYNKLLDEDKTELDKYNELQKLYIESSANYDIYRKQYNNIRDEKEKIDQSLLVCTNNIEAYEEQLNDIEMYKEQIEWFDTNMKKRRELQNKDTELRFEFNDAQALLDKKEKEYNSHKDALSEYEKSLAVLKITIDNLKKAVPDINGRCPFCNTPLSEHKKEELQKEIEQITSELKGNEDKLSETENSISKENEWLKNNTLQSFKDKLASLSKEMVDISNAISTIDTYAEDIDIDKAKDVVNNTQSALDNERKRQDELSNKLNNIDKELSELSEKLSSIPNDYSDKIARLNRGISDSQQQIATLTAEITMAKKDLSYLEQSAELIKKIKDEIKEHQNNIKDYEIIKLSFSNNGIQALELDSAAPEISIIANEILNETYGDRFRILFDTQRDTKDRRKIDDFIIKVFDANSGRDKRLDLISSGEGALIKQVLYYAFSVIRIRRTGFCFKTRFLDESDGSLDSETRVQYLKMIEAAHNQCKAVQTILITHSQELKELIDQKIEL